MAAMKAIRLSFVRVSKGAAPTPATIRPGVNEVSAFLCAHAQGLMEKADDGSAANATFYDVAREQLIKDLQVGSDAKFLAAADVLATRLCDEMNHVGNPASGLLVCTTFEHGSAASRIAAVLKLEVVSDQGAVLRRLDSGEETLAAVTNVLDRPGDLQKGLVYPDSRPRSSAVVGDKAAQQEARYFLKSVGITLEARPNASAAALVAAVGKYTDRQTAQQVVEALPAVSEGSPREVLQEIRGQGVTIPDPAVAVIVDELTNADRPVPRVDVSAPVKGKVRAGGLTVSGSASDIAGVTWDSDPSGGWVTIIHSDTEPTVTWS